MHRHPRVWFKRVLRRMVLRGWLFLLVVGVVHETRSASAPPLARLPALGAAAESVTVSGLSSGAYMAEQFAVAHSASVAGVALIAGGPYGCSRGSVYNAMTKCSCPSESNVMLDSLSLWPGAGCHVFSPTLMQTLAEMAVAANRDGIDDPRHLARQRVWLLAGEQDRVVHADLVEAAMQLHLALGVPEPQLRRVSLPDAGHGMPSLSASQRCDRTASPFLTQCSVDTAGELLRWLYAPGDTMQRVTSQASALRRFQQGPYTAGLGFTGLDRTGWVYLPARCRTGAHPCKVHVAFHGCQQGQSFRSGGKAFGRQFVDGAGYNEWAEGSDMIVLYPQVQPTDTGQTTQPYRHNPKGCWDFWGYTQPHGASLGGSAGTVRYPFASQGAPQIQAVKRMVDDLLRQP